MQKGRRGEGEMGEMGEMGDGEMSSFHLMVQVVGSFIA
jgi:hypothetical protein